MNRQEILDFLEWPLGEDNMVPRMHSEAKKQWQGMLMRTAEKLAEPHDVAEVLELDRLHNWANIAANALADAQERVNYIQRTLRGDKVK